MKRVDTTRLFHLFNLTDAKSPNLPQPDPPISNKEIVSMAMELISYRRSIRTLGNELSIAGLLPEGAEAWKA
jgi:hypothetical protein